MNVLETKCLISLVRVSRMDCVRNEKVRIRDGIEMKQASRVDQRLFGWLGHVERMDEDRVARRLLMAEDGIPPSAKHILGQQMDDSGS